MSNYKWYCRKTQFVCRPEYVNYSHGSHVFQVIRGTPSGDRPIYQELVCADNRKQAIIAASDHRVGS